MTRSVCEFFLSMHLGDPLVDLVFPDLGHHHHGKLLSIGCFQGCKVARCQMYSAEVHQFLGMLAPQTAAPRLKEMQRWKNQ